MKSSLHLLLGTSAVSLLAYSSLAAETTASRPTPTPEARGFQGGHADRPGGAVRATEIIGMTVNNYQDQKLGTVNDLAVDVESGRLVQVILSSGGFFGVGDTLTAVPPGALHHDGVQKVLHLNTDKEALKAAPKFEMSRWAECCDSNHLAQVYQYHGQERALNFVGPQEESTQATPGVARHDSSTISPAGLGRIQRASKLMSLPVKNLQDETLGAVENLLLDLPSGRIVALIVSSGGFLGIGDALSPLPPTALRFAANQDHLEVDASREKLAGAPHFRAAEWPDFAEPGFVSGVYRAYQVDPYFTTGVVSGADDTIRNIRDRDDQTLSPSDQGNSQADVDTTAEIRRQIVALDDLSLNAQNVKIITSGGQVTLRGPVDTAGEKTAIGNIAIAVAQHANVSNQLEVR